MAQTQEVVKLLLAVPADAYYSLSAKSLAKKTAGDRSASIKKEALRAISEYVGTEK